jgi:hypothetical protein
MNKPPIAAYFYRGFTMSRRAMLAHKNNEHPVTHWMKELGLEKELIRKMLIYAGYHHTGKYVRRTTFYRLPKWENEFEMRRFIKAFHTIPATKKKCIRYLSELLQEPLEDFATAGSKHLVTHFRSYKENPKYVRLSQLI